MLNLSDVITDPELGGGPFVILRPLYRKSEGEKILIREDRIETEGSVHPAPARELELLPEEYRYETVRLIHSRTPLSLGAPVSGLEFTGPDRILYRSRSWLVISVRDWPDSGFCKALAVLRREPAGA